VTNETAIRAVHLGLLRLAPQDSPFPGRKGNEKPYIIDARGAGTNIKLRLLIVSLLSDLLQTYEPFDVIGGVSKSGVTWGSWLAWDKRAAYATVLPDGPRTSGLQRSVEGDVRGKRVVLVDNWVRTGESLSQAIEQVSIAGGEVVGAVAIARHEASSVGFKLSTIWTDSELLEAMSVHSQDR